MPLSEKARIEVYLPDVSRPEYQELLAELEQEFTYTFGGCTTLLAEHRVAARPGPSPHRTGRPSRDPVQPAAR